VLWQLSLRAGSIFDAACF